MCDWIEPDTDSDGLDDPNETNTGTYNGPADTGTEGSGDTAAEDTGPADDSAAPTDDTGEAVEPCTLGLQVSVDGATPLADLMSVSGMDRFEALRSIHRMHEAGILEWD